MLRFSNESKHDDWLPCASFLRCGTLINKLVKIWAVPWFRHQTVTMGGRFVYWQWLLIRFRAKNHFHVKVQYLKKQAHGTLPGELECVDLVLRRLRPSQRHLAHPRRMHAEQWRVSVQGDCEALPRQSAINKEKGHVDGVRMICTYDETKMCTCHSWGKMGNGYKSGREGLVLNSWSMYLGFWICENRRCRKSMMNACLYSIMICTSGIIAHRAPLSRQEYSVHEMNHTKQIY